MTVMDIQKTYSTYELCVDSRNEIFFLCLRKSANKKTLKLELEKWRLNILVCFFKCLLNFRTHALKLELNKVSISNFAKFRLQSMSSKIERAFEKTTTFSIKMKMKMTYKNIFPEPQIDSTAYIFFMRKYLRKEEISQWRGDIFSQRIYLSKINIS